MKRKVFSLLIIISCLIVSAIPINSVYAKDDNTLGFTVSPVQPKTQLDPEKGYYYIKTTPGEQQTLEVRLQSTKKEDVRVKIYGVNAYTGNNGTIEYTEDLSAIDETLNQPLTSLIQIETPEITIGNFEEKTVKIQITSPPENYSGVKMGALVFLLDNGKQKSGVSTEYSYKVGLVTAENGDEFNDGKTLKLNSVKAAMSRGKKMVLAQLQNPEPKTIENLNIIATMTKKGSGEVIKQKTVQNYKLAPNSHFDFELDWGVNKLPSGSYTLNLKAKNYNENWELSKDFTITNEEAEKINEASVIKIVTPMWLKITGSLFLAISILIMVILLLRRRKWEQAWKKLRIANKKKRKKNKRVKR